MAGIQYFGRIGQTGTATGPHGHVYVRDLLTNEYVDPNILRSPFQGLRIGEQKIPAFIQDSSGRLNINPQSGIQLTSDYGRRNAPTKGASTDHKGQDWALPEGTPIYFEGAGQFVPKPNQGGFGNLATFITPDKRYELGIGHMQSLGGAAELGGASVAPGTTQPDGAAKVDDLLKAVALGMQLNTQKQPSFAQQMQYGILNELTKPRTNLAQQFLGSFLANELS